MSELLPPYTFILEKLKSNKVIPFLGAGASLGGRQPRRDMEKGSENLPSAGRLGE